MRIHLQGMGVTGSLLARLLAHSGLSFTWHDIEAERVSWKAATGAIYPCEDEPGLRDLVEWQNWVRKGGPFTGEPWCEEADYWSVFLKPGAPPKPLELSPTFSVHVNAQVLVRSTRQRFAASRRTGEVEADYVIVAHGFNSRMQFTHWGWSGLVELHSKLPANGRRPCIYYRKGSLMFYAYPVPGRPEAHYAGSSIIRQKLGKEHSLVLTPKYETWQKHFGDLAKVSVGRILEPLVEGWRPAMESGEKDTSVLVEGNRLTVPPLDTNGIRRFPSVWRNLFKEL
jgi:hypothetical protein